MAYVVQTPPGQGTLVTPAYMAQSVDNDQFLRANLGVMNSVMGYSVLSSPGGFNFPNLSGNYTSLVIDTFFKPTANQFALIRFNGDNGNNYSSQRWLAHYTTSDSGEGNAATAIQLYAGQSIGDPWVFYRIILPNWIDGSNFKLVHAIGGLVRSTASVSQMRAEAMGVWDNTDPITRVQLLSAGGGSFAAGSWMAIYATHNL